MENNDRRDQESREPDDSESRMRAMRRLREAAERADGPDAEILVWAIKEIEAAHQHSDFSEALNESNLRVLAVAARVVRATTASGVPEEVQQEGHLLQEILEELWGPWAPPRPFDCGSAPPDYGRAD